MTKLVGPNDYIGIAKSGFSDEEIAIKGSLKEQNAIRCFAKYGRITFSKEDHFKSTAYNIHFFKPVAALKNMYNLGNEVLILCCSDGMRDFKSRTKDYLDYLLSTKEEYRNRLDRITCIVIDASADIVDIVKNDRMEHPDTRLIVPFKLSEFDNGFDEDFLQNRMREFLYVRDLFGVATPLSDDLMFFGTERNNVISELYGKYKQGEHSGLFGLRRIGKTSVLYLLKNRVNRNGGAAIYIDCQQYHHSRWNIFLHKIIKRIVDELLAKRNQDIECSLPESFIWDDSENRYREDEATLSFEKDLKSIYFALGETRILLIFDEIESIGFSTSPSEHWKTMNDALYFWEAIRSVSQTNNSYFSYVVAGVNPMCVELAQINEYPNPIFSSFSPIYVSLFDYNDVKNMVSSIGGHIGLKFEEPVYAKLVEDYGGHPFLTRQVCSRINKELLDKKTIRPATVTRHSYDDRSKEYQLDMVNVIEQILIVLKNYYPREYDLLKKLALDGKNTFKSEILEGDKLVQHLLGYCLLEKEDGEYYIRIKSIEKYLRDKHINDRTITDQTEKRQQINLRRDKIEVVLREIIWNAYSIKYGKKTKEKIVEIACKTTKDESIEKRIKSAIGKKCMDELFFNQLKDLMEANWKDFAVLFPDKQRFAMCFDMINRSRQKGTHAKPLDDENESIYRYALSYFEDALSDFM